MGRGRPCRFNEDLKQRLIELYRQGLTDKQVAEQANIPFATLKFWKKKFPDFLATLKDLKDIADGIVEASLYHRALGYSHIEEKVFCYMGQIVTHKVVKHYPPDVTAQIFWLKNRQPERWRDVQVIEKMEAEAALKESKKKTFEEFCIDAGYPKPYPKQVEMFNFGIAIDDPRLLLGSRGYGKTDYVTIMGVAYDVYLNGIAASHLIITKSKARNSAIIEEIANALEKNGIKLEKKNTNYIRLEGLVGKEHSIEVLTIKSSFRGRHPKIIIMDDPVTEEDTSEAMRALVKKKYDEAYKLCKNILIIGQPAHQFDLYAELRPQLKKLEVPYGMIPELDHDLEAMKLAGVDPRSIEMSYHLRIPQDGTAPFDKIRYIDEFPMGGSAVAFIDPSFEGGDYTALSIIKAFGQGVAVVGFTYKKAWNHCLVEMAQKLHLYGVQKLCFETNSLGDQPLQILRDAFGGKVGVVGKKSNTNKHSRIMAAGSFAHLIHLSKQSDRVYTDQVVKYEYKAKHDDAPDSLASCLEWIGLIRGKQ